MPIAGSVGAISAANRASRSRQGGGLGRSTVGHRAPLATPPCARPTKDARVGGAAPGAAAPDSSPGMLATLRQKVGVFKKQQQALAEKMHKGLAMTGMTSGAKKAAPPEVSAQEQDASHSIDPALIGALEAMGFEAPKIREAVAVLGPHPAQMDDLLQVLLSMHDGGDAAPDGAPDRHAAPDPASVPQATQAAAPPRASPPLPAASSSGPEEPAPELSSGYAARLRLAASGPAAASEQPGPSEAPPPPPLPAMSACGSAEFEGVAGRLERRQAAAAARRPQPQVLSDGAFARLQGMGFAPRAIQQAAATLGRGATADDLFDALIAMGAPVSPQHSSTAAPSTCSAPGSARAVGAGLAAADQGAGPREPTVAGDLLEGLGSADAVAAVVVADMVEDVQKAEFARDMQIDDADLVHDVETDSVGFSDSNPACCGPIDREAAQAIDTDFEAELGCTDEVPIHALAAAVVASVIANASSKEATQLQEAPQPEMKHMAEHRLIASPVRGGA